MEDQAVYAGIKIPSLARKVALGKAKAKGVVWEKRGDNMKKLILTLLLVLCFALPVGAGNDTTGQTWVLDSTGSISTEWTNIVWIIWTDINADGDALVIHEKASGKLIVKLKGIASVDMLVGFPGNSGRVPGFYLTTLSSGEVLVRVK